MKRDIQRIFLAAVIPLFFLFVLYMLKILEVGMDWDFTRLGIYPMEKRGLFGIFAHPLVHSSFKHLAANTLPLLFLSWWVSVLFLSWYRPIYFFLNMDWRWRFHLSFRQKWMAHRIQRTHLWPSLLFILQRYFPQTRTSHCPLAIDHVPLWWAGLEYVPPVCQGYYFMGRTHGWSNSRHAVRSRLHKIRPATSRSFCRRRKRRRR